MATQHRLSNVDLTAMTADCEVCGEVELEKKGKRGVRCKEAGRELRRRYKQRNSPTSGPSRHSLHGGTTCPVCGPVEPVPWGRGFMCPNRALELGWRPADAISPRCHRCDTFLIAGVCQFCTPVRADIRDGMHVDELPLTGRTESVVDDWRVIGPPIPPDSPWAKYLLDMEV